MCHQSLRGNSNIHFWDGWIPPITLIITSIYKLHVEKIVVPFNIWTCSIYSIMEAEFDLKYII